MFNEKKYAIPPEMTRIYFKTKCAYKCVHLLTEKVLHEC